METIITPDPLICVHVSVNHFVSIHANRVWPSPPLPRWPLLRPLARRAHGHTYRRDMRGDRGPSGRCSCLPCSNNPHHLSRRADPRGSLSQEGRRGQRAGTWLHRHRGFFNEPPPALPGRAAFLGQAAFSALQPLFPGPAGPTLSWAETVWRRYPACRLLISQARSPPLQAPLWR